MLAAQLEKTIQNLCYNGPKRGFNFTMYVERHKAAYQTMLALAKKTDCTTYDPSTCVCHFLNGIMDPALAQAKLSLKANCKMNSVNFDATVEYFMNQVQHHQVTHQLNIASVGGGAPGCLRNCDDQGNNLEIPLIAYSPEDWAQSSSFQKSSIRKRSAAADGE